MRFFVTFIFTLAVAVAYLYPQRQQLLLIDSGVNVTKEIEPFLCKEGHKSFTDESPLNDETGHGSAMAATMAEKLDPFKHCIVVYKVYNKKKIDTTAFFNAILKAENDRFKAVVIAHEDEGYYNDEIAVFKNLSLRSVVFVAAGNGGKNLSYKCDVYPACLAENVKSENFRVVGGTEDLNRGGPINEVANPDKIFNNSQWHGTSVSTARAASQFVNPK